MAPSGEYLPDTGFDMNNGMPPRCRNQREPTACDTPAASAALSLVIPVAICIQNWRSTSRRSAGAPGERIASLPVNCFIHPAGRPINTSWLKVLRRPVESAQYTSNDFQQLLKAQGITCSMSRRGECWDNAAMESFFSSMKTERLSRKVYRTREEARSDVFDYIERFYNPVRKHSKLDFLSPVDFEQGLMG